MITVVAYDPAWPARFETLRQTYAAALAAASVDVRAIEHVGSTSVPGLAAKPIIDCDIVVEASQVELASKVLLALGFRPLGQLGIPERWAFKEPSHLTGTNTYVVVAGSVALRNHVGVREVLRADPGLRDRYGAVKQSLAATAETIEAYGQGKTAVIQQILAVAGLSEVERTAIANVQVPTRDEIPR